MVQQKLVSTVGNNESDGIHQDKPQLHFDENILWEEFHFQELFKIKNGLNKGKEFFGYGIPILNYMDVNKNVSNTKESINGLVDVDRNEIKRYNVKPNDLFFTRTSETSDEIGLTSAYIGELIDCVFSGFILRARPIRDDVNSLFFAYYLRSEKSRANIIKYSSITTRALISGSNLYKMKVKMPNINEQNKIANFLSFIDKKIELLEKNQEIYSNFKKFLLQNIFSQKLRFNEFSEEWEEVCLKEIYSMKYGKLPNKDKITDDSSKYPIYSGFRVLGYYGECNIKKGDLLITARGSRVGLVKLALEDSFLTNLSISLELNTDAVINEYIYYYFQLNNLNYLDSGSAQPQIIIKDLMDVKVKIPSVEEQVKIIEIFSNIDKKLSYMDSALNLIFKFKKGLLQKMFI